MLSWIKWQGNVKGLDYIDFNFPQHLNGKVSDNEVKQIKQALDEAGLECGAICLRFPKSMQAGAFTSPDKAVRDEAVRLVMDACEWAEALSSDEVVVWSAYDGYDYSLQVNYFTMWDNMVWSFREICDAYPDVKISLEYKPTDENTRWTISCSFPSHIYSFFLLSLFLSISLSLSFSFFSFSFICLSISLIDTSACLRFSPYLSILFCHTQPLKKLIFLFYVHVNFFLYF